MKYVTRKLLKFRPGSEYVGPVRYEPRGNPERECWANADKEFVENSQMPVPGWIIGPMDENGHTGIFRHFWNKDNEGRHYDTTPFPCMDHQNYDYVKDNEVYIEAVRLQEEGYFKDKFSNSVPNLFYINDKFAIQDLRNSNTRSDINHCYTVAVDADRSLSIEQLFKLSYLDGEIKQSDIKTELIC